MMAQRPKLVEKKPKRVKPEVVLDDIFFHKSQLHYGTRLIYYGRWEPLSIWEVIDIRSHFLGKEVGDVKVKKVNEIRYLSDSLTVRNIKTSETRQVSFSYLSYSAIWRLQE
jgi:hypothetical protein